MLVRIAAITDNTFREAVRARVLFGLLGLALATCAYSLVIATLSLKHETRAVADLGAASISLYAILVAIVLSATSLYRELEQKTIFPILTRNLRRHEYIIGKFFGTVMTLAVFIAIDSSAVLGILAGQNGQSASLMAALYLGIGVGYGLTFWRAKAARTFAIIPWSAVLLLASAYLAEPAEPERRLVLASAALTLGEVGILSGVAVLFSSFSSPFLTALLTFGVLIVGRSADLLGHLPARAFPEWLVASGRVLSRVVPNLHLYVPPRVVLLGQAPETPIWTYVASASLHAVCYCVVLLALSSLVFRKRDFQ